MNIYIYIYRRLGILTDKKKQNKIQASTKDNTMY